MVWLHGGAFEFGAGSLPAYDGTRLAEREVVVVTVNYRLGCFGMFAHPLLTEESGHGASGNYALMDQIAALQWVSRNIAAFGGDPNNVTISHHFETMDAAKAFAGGDRLREVIRDAGVEGEPAIWFVNQA